MREKQYAAIEQYLSKSIPNRGIEQKNDFDLSAQTFKVHIEKDSLLLKVSESFVDDHDISWIIAQFEKWKLPALLSKDSSVAILVGNEGVNVLKRR